MKCHFVLLLLLHLGANAGNAQDQNLTNEIISRLQRLNELYVQKNLTLTSTLQTPNMRYIRKWKYVFSCVNHVVNLLKRALTNVTLRTENHLLEELQGNLDQLLSRHPQGKCDSTENQYKGVQPFKPYINFLKSLNETPTPTNGK